MFEKNSCLISFVFEKNSCSKKFMFKKIYVGKNSFSKNLCSEKIMFDKLCSKISWKCQKCGKILQQKMT